MDIFLRRGKHPYMTSTYINGFVKDTPLLNKSEDETFVHIQQNNREFGRYPVKHSRKKVISEITSVQGIWENDDKWNNYPKHMLEKKNDIPVSWVQPKPLKEIKNKRAKSDYYTAFLRKRFAVEPAKDFQS